MTSMAYLGLVYLEKGDTQKAIKMLERAKSLSDSLPAALGPLGCAYARAEKKQKWHRQFESCKKPRGAERSLRTIWRQSTRRWAIRRARFPGCRRHMNLATP